MNKIKTTVLLQFAVLFCGLALHGQKPNIDELLAKVAGNQTEKAVLEAAKSRDYSTLYEMMHPDWSEAVREETFLSILEKKEFSLESIHFSRSNEYSDFSYHIVHFSSHEEGRKINSEEVLFLKKDDEEWKLMNFPFLLNGLPNFTRIPEITYK